MLSCEAYDHHQESHMTPAAEIARMYLWGVGNLLLQHTDLPEVLIAITGEYLKEDYHTAAEKKRKKCSKMIRESRQVDEMRSKKDVTSNQLIVDETLENKRLRID